MTHNGIDLEELIHPFVASKEVCLLRVQYLYELAKKIGEFPKCDLSNPSVAEFTVRAQDLGSLRIEFERCVSEINAMSKRHLPEFVPSYKEVQEFDILYYEIKKVASCISSSVKTEPKVKNETTGAEAKCRVKLPELQIYKFDGKVENWTTFRDTFRTLIHENSTISNIEKYYYLLSSVSGQALSIVKSMPVSGDNYAIVWSALQKRYENKRMLATAYLDKMFNFKPMTETASNLNNFVQTYQENMIALEQLGIPYMASFILFYVALRSLDPVTRREFEQTMAPGDIPNMTDLLQFVERQARVLEMTECKIASIKSAIPTKPSTSKSASTAYQNSDASKSSFTKRPSLATGVASADNSESRNFHTCLYCQKPHSIYRCIDYNNLTPEQRTAKVIELKLCENCLRDDHTVAECTSKYSCTVCKKRHHVTLHMDSTDTPKEDSVTLMCSTKRTVLLGTANIHVADAWGQYHLVRAVIDGGAMSSFITQDLAKKLGLTRRKCNFEPVGLGGNRVEQFGLTTCTIKPRNNSEPIMTTDSVIVSNIAGHLPTTCLPNNVVSQFQNLELADPAFHQPATVDMLIAGDLFPYIYTGEKIFPAESGMPVAMNSIFGYIIGGAAVINNENQKVSMVTTAAEGVTESIFCGFTGTMNMDQIMNRFWEVENIPSEKPKKPDDILAEELFAQEHSRDESGRYIVRYPFRPDHELGESRQIAVRRLCNLEAKLDRDPQLKEEYHKFMSEYESLGHMTCLGEMPNVSSKYVAPHFCIIKPSSTTTKLRTVFDMACKSTNHKSLNDVVLPGPKLQADINQILINFRLHEICLSADICKMYRQIMIHEDQRAYQHILWRYSTDQPIKVYELNTVTYGVSSSPYLAIKVLHTLADSEKESYPTAAQVLKTGFFMDDLLWSEPTIEDALQLQIELRTILQRAGFVLRKWSSNCSQVLAAVPEDHRETPIEFDEEQNFALKVLGLQWQPATDCFSFCTATVEKEITKRTILSQIGRLFDPLGFVSPCVFYAKCFMQKLWAVQLDWDQSLPPHLESEWITFVKELPLLSELQHERHVMVKQSIIHRILGFCDASTLGYAAVVYLFTENENNETKTSLLIAKSKVAPLKTLSVPRLELMAAHLLAKLVKYVALILQERDVCIDDILLFTDSSVVLAWLNTPSYKLKIFVATRVTKILETFPANHWRHVSGESNPADVCSRGALPSTLMAMSEWLHGPHWILNEKWPVRNIDEFRDENPPEMKHSTESKNLLSAEPPSNDIYDLTQRHSNFNKLLNVVARVHQFIRYCRTTVSQRTGLSIVDLRKAHDSLIKSVQQHHFCDDMAALSKGQQPQQSLRKLNPFIDPLGFLRVGGRLSQTNMSYEKKHPVLVPKKSNFTYTLIDYYHILYLHVGPRTLQGILSQKYWIISARSVIRTRTMKCISCFKVRPTTRQPIMGQLPKFRTQDIHTFHTVGVDIGGPFYTKESTRRNARIYKSYLCVFVCCATRAVHLETLTSLSAECFLASFDRFSHRRGLCQAIISDNGTNFVAAGRQLAEVTKFLNENCEELSNGFITRKVEWKYNPPAGSHFGGLYEAAIKSAKTLLKRTVQNRALSFEELTTLFTRIEAVLNSRPLCALSSDPSEFEVLTPAHFLIGRDLLQPPEYDLTSLPQNRLNRWQAVQQIAQHFWRLWRKDYLHTLQQRQKWLDNSRDLQVGDLVLLHSDAPPLQWVLGRVTKLHPGPDNVVRVVSVRTKTSEFTRPVVKLSPLPLEQESN